jgi:hypothetical protein
MLTHDISDAGCGWLVWLQAIKKDVLIAEQERVIAERELMIKHMDEELKSSNSKVTYRRQSKKKKRYKR